MKYIECKATTVVYQPVFDADNLSKVVGFSKTPVIGYVIEARDFVSPVTVEGIVDGPFVLKSCESDDYFCLPLLTRFQCDCSGLSEAMIHHLQKMSSLMRQSSEKNAEAKNA